MLHGLLHAACDVETGPGAEIMDKMSGGDAAVFEGVWGVGRKDCVEVDAGGEGGLLEGGYGGGTETAHEGGVVGGVETEVLGMPVLRVLRDENEIEHAV